MAMSIWPGSSTGPVGHAHWSPARSKNRIDSRFMPDAMSGIPRWLHAAVGDFGLGGDGVLGASDATQLTLTPVTAAARADKSARRRRSGTPDSLLVAGDRAAFANAGRPPRAHRPVLLPQEQTDRLEEVLLLRAANGIASRILTCRPKCTSLEREAIKFFELNACLSHVFPQ